MSSWTPIPEIRDQVGPFACDFHARRASAKSSRDPAYDRSQALYDDGNAFAERVLSYHTSKTVIGISKTFFYSVVVHQLLRNDAFVPGEIAFVDGDSILRFVADTRHQARSFQKFNTAFSDFIIHRTAELLVEDDLVPLLTASLNLSKIAPVQCASQGVLRSMSLVHKSWTHPSQCAMRTAISLFDIKGLYVYLISPSRGPWLRALRYETPESEWSCNAPATETTQFLSAVMEAAPNLEYLTIGTIIHSELFLCQGLPDHRPQFSWTSSRSYPHYRV